MRWKRRCHIFIILSPIESMWNYILIRQLCQVYVEEAEYDS